MLKEKQRGLSALLRTLVCRQVVMAMIIVSLGVGEWAMAFPLNTAFLPAADAGHDATLTGGEVPPNPQFLRFSIAITQGRVTVGPLISPAWVAAHQGIVRLPPAGHALTPEEQQLQTAQREPTLQRLSGVETLLLRTMYAPRPSKTHPPLTAESAPALYGHSSVAQQLDQEHLTRQRLWGRPSTPPGPDAQQSQPAPALAPASARLSLEKSGG